MTLKKLKELLEAHSKVSKEIEEIAAPIYKRRTELLAEIIPALIEKKAPDTVGMLTSPVTIKFKDGRTWTMRPLYVNKGGEFKGAVFKNSPSEIFSLTEKQKEELPF